MPNPKLVNFRDADGCELSLPDFLFYEDNSRLKSIGPHAYFDSAAALDGQAWQGASAPSRQMQKKAIIIDSSTFIKPFMLEEVMAYIVRLKNAGFPIYLKTKTLPFFEVSDDFKGLQGAISNLEKFDSKRDPQNLAEKSVAYERAVVLDYEKRGEVEKLLEKVFLQGDGFYGDDYHLNLRCFSYEEMVEKIEAESEKGPIIIFFLGNCSDEDAKKLLQRYGSTLNVNNSLYLLKKLSQANIDYYLSVHEEKMNDPRLFCQIAKIIPNKIRFLIDKVKKPLSYKFNLDCDVADVYEAINEDDKKYFAEFVRGNTGTLVNAEGFLGADQLKNLMIFWEICPEYCQRVYKIRQESSGKTYLKSIPKIDIELFLARIYIVSNGSRRTKYQILDFDCLMECIESDPEDVELIIDSVFDKEYLLMDKEQLVKILIPKRKRPALRVKFHFRLNPILICLQKIYPIAQQSNSNFELAGYSISC